MTLSTTATPEGRFRADTNFIRSLVKALKLPNSFEYPFDSLQTISRLYAPDSSFRIFTWQYKKDNLLYLQEGAIQMNQPDGSLKLFPLVRRLHVHQRTRWIPFGREQTGSAPSITGSSKRPGRRKNTIPSRL